MKRRPSQSYGFLQVAEVAPELRVADVEFNVAKIVAAMDRAVEHGASIILFPELSIAGYTCGDLFNQSALIAGAQEVLQKLAVFTKDLDLQAGTGDLSEAVLGWCTFNGRSHVDVSREYRRP